MINKPHRPFTASSTASKLHRSPVMYLMACTSFKWLCKDSCHLLILLESLDQDAILNSTSPPDHVSYVMLCVSMNLSHARSPFKCQVELPNLVLPNVRRRRDDVEGDHLQHGSAGRCFNSSNMTRLDFQFGIDLNMSIQALSTK